MRDPESKGHEAVRVQVGESRCQRAGCPLKCKGGMPGREQLGPAATLATGWPVFPGREQIRLYLPLIRLGSQSGQK